MAENGQAVRLYPPRRVKSPKTGRVYVIRDAWLNPREVAYCEYAVKQQDGSIAWHRTYEGAEFADMQPFEE